MHPLHASKLRVGRSNALRGCHSATVRLEHHHKQQQATFQQETAQFQHRLTQVTHRAEQPRKEHCDVMEKYRNEVQRR